MSYNLHATCNASFLVTPEAERLSEMPACNDAQIFDVGCCGLCIGLHPMIPHGLQIWLNLDIAQLFPTELPSINGQTTLTS